MAIFIINPSRGGAAPSVSGDPTGAKALDSLRVSIRESATFVNLTSIQMGVGFSRVHALGVDGGFNTQLPRTRLGSILSPSAFTSNPTFTVLPADGLRITKTDDLPQASSYITSLDQAGSSSLSAMITGVLRADTIVNMASPSEDPEGPTLALEHGPRNTAVYLTLFRNPFIAPPNRLVRVSGPVLDGVRTPVAFFPLDWSTGHIQYIIFWNEVKRRVEVWTDDTAGAGGIGNATLRVTIPIADFAQFGANGSIRLGGAGDVTGIYGVEGKNTTAATFRSIAVATDVGFPFVDGVRTGGWKSYLDSDLTCGFSGGVDPTRLDRGGAWFITPGGDPDGTLSKSTASGFCRLQKATPSTAFSISRDERGFIRTATDGLMVDFKCNTSTTGGSGFATGAAIKITDGQTLFQLDFLNDGVTRNVGILKVGGDPGDPLDHLLPTSPVDYALRTLRLVVDPRRVMIDLYDVEDMAAPLGSWPLVRADLPVAVTYNIVVGLPVDTTTAVGTFDIYNLKYSYLYQAWEALDAIAPTAADPPYTGGPSGTIIGPLNAAVMPGMLPLPYSGNGVGQGTGSVEADGYHINCPGGSTLVFQRLGPFDVDRGGIFEARLKIIDWHSSQRTGVFGMLDDDLNAYMLSFVETADGRFVCIPLSAGVGQFQEYAGETGLAAKVSVKVDWTEFHTYRLERRPRDGVYLYIDGAETPALVLLDSAGYSFPSTQLNDKIVAFGQFTEEGAESVWSFVRGFFGAGYELATKLDQTDDQARARLANARTTVVVTGT